jgi:hypothetical protein
MSTVEEDEKKRIDDIQKLFKEFKTEIEKRQVSSSENFDKSILTYASWALGISIAFLKDFIPITVASFSLCLYASWIFFSYSIASTTISFLISYKGLEQSLQDGIKYFLEEDDSYFDKENKYNTAVKYLNQTSGAAFILGLICTLIFVMSNLEKSAMFKKSFFTNDGMPANLMTKIPEPGLHKGLPSPVMQKIPPAIPRPTPASPSTSTPSSTTTNTPASKNKAV